ncbi:MAG TPA: type II secretion system F family protein [Dehalococcoidales bacterium]|nr:type II secretion system F family protein [Dehalococcoidales bacterium]
MLYQYIACGESGDIVKGKISATNENAITEMLSYAGYRLINLRPYVPFLSLGKLTAKLFTVKPTEITMLFRQLALLLESGINIVTALELLQEQITNRALKKVVTEVIEDIRNGNQLSTAMSRHPDIFSSMACRTLSIGEQTGGLETMLRQIAEYMEKELITRKGIKGALMYPMIAAVVTVVVVGVLMFFVLPAFADLYGSLGAKLPALTRIMIDFSVFLRNYVLHIFLIIFIIIGLAFIYFRTATGKYRLDAIMLRIPQLGRVKHLNELSRCCRSISLLFTAGLPLPEIMPLVIQGCNNRVMAQALYNVQIDMLKGEGLSKPMAKNSLFLPMMVQMVKVGEETGSLDTSLVAVAQNYESDAQDKTKSLISMIQPVMTIVIAGIVGLIALSMVSAMYSMYGQAF